FLPYAGILAGGVLRQTLLEHSLRFFVDDAYIFLRYARRAVTGHGLVYNEAQHVLGFTSPLYVAVLAGAGAVGGPRGLVGEANLVDLAFYAMASVTLVWLARRREASLPILMIAWLVWFPLVAAGVNGMETMLFILLQYGALLLAVRGNEGWAVTVAAFAALSRPEGAIFMVVLVAAALLHRRPTLRAWRSGVVGLAALGAWALYALVTYHTVIPQSIIAKGALRNTSGNPVQKLAVSALGLSTSQYGALSPKVTKAAIVLGIAALAMILVGLVVDVRRRAVAAAVPAWFVLTWLLYVVGHPIQLWSWYTAPLTLAVWWTVARHGPTGLSWALSLLPRHARRPTKDRERTGTRPASVILVMTALVASALSVVVGVEKRQKSLDSSVVGLSRLAQLVDQVAPHAHSLFIDDIGIVGWASDDSIVDGAGLVSPLATIRRNGKLLSVDTLTRTERIDVVALKADPALGDKVADLLLRRPIFDDAGQRADLLASYREVDAYGLGGYRVLLVRRAPVP
nr:hypothetical protein [Actinomycetota bacterium]